MPHPIITWVLFALFVLAMLALDLGVFHRKAHVVRIREALYWSLLWIAMALVFNLGILLFWPEHHPDLTARQAALQFLTGYLLEKSLSVDNLFVFLLIFSYFKVSPVYQHKVLFWGILGALAMRLLFILAGLALIERFHFIIYLFGAFLVYTAVKMALHKGAEVHPERNPVLRLCRRILPVTPEYVEGRFFLRRSGRWMVTPMFIVLVVVESSDVVFAVDSIPAILAISRDPFIIYTSNVFAILGLRALYFALAGIMALFHYLHYGLAAVLGFVGVKMLVVDFYHVPEGWSLGIIAAILSLSMLASKLWPQTQADAK
jgi:tellurite resistance protein TerC